MKLLYLFYGNKYLFSILIEETETCIMSIIDHSYLFHIH